MLGKNVNRVSFQFAPGIDGQVNLVDRRLHLGTFCDFLQRGGIIKSLGGLFKGIDFKQFTLQERFHISGAFCLYTVTCPAVCIQLDFALLNQPIRIFDGGTEIPFPQLQSDFQSFLMGIGNQFFKNGMHRRNIVEIASVSFR